MPSASAVVASGTRVAERVLVPGSNILVLGHAREGKAAARFLAGYDLKVTVADRSITETEWRGGVTLASESAVDLEGVDAVVVSPGIPSDNHVLAEAERRDLLITNGTQLFLELAPCPVIGITGSSGKSTTSSLTAAILRVGGRPVGLGGNIGHPMLDLLPELHPDSVAVVEMSSFQLELVRQSPHVAVVTNLSPNHLDRHGSMDAYAQAKRRIVAYQRRGDVVVVNGDDQASIGLVDGSVGEHVTFSWDRQEDSGAFVAAGEVVRRRNGVEDPVIPVSELPLPGRHNLENALAAVAATNVFDVPTDSVRKAIAAFTGLPHRLQRTAEIGGVTYVDDSIATSPERAAVGMRSVRGPVVWIAGGRSKHLPWDLVLDAGLERVHAVVLVGEASDEIDAAIREYPGWSSVDVVRAESLDRAVAVAAGRAHPGDTVLFSPGGTSFDQFADFEARGRAFQSAVRGLRG